MTAQEEILSPGGEGERGRGSIRRRASPKGSADMYGGHPRIRADDDTATLERDQHGRASGSGIAMKINSFGGDRLRI